MKKTPNAVLLLGVMLASFPIATPARAAYIFEDINLSFGNGFQEIGKISFVAVPEFEAIGWNVGPTLYFAGAPVPNGPQILQKQLIGNDIHRFYGDLSQQGNVNTVNYFEENFVINAANLPNLTLSDFSLNGITARAGNISCVSGCDISSVPLPAALPMLSTGLLALMGFAAWRSRRV